MTGLVVVAADKLQIDHIDIRCAVGIQLLVGRSGQFQRRSVIGQDGVVTDAAREKLGRWDGLPDIRLEEHPGAREILL
jgi:hypothetical protein